MAAVGERPRQDGGEEQVHQRQLGQEPQEGGEVEIERVVPAGQPVVDGQRQRYQRAPTAIGGHCRKGACVGEEPRQVTQVADEDVLGDGVDIVEMELVAEVVGVGKGNRRQNQHCGDGRFTLHQH